MLIVKCEFKACKHIKCGFCDNPNGVIELFAVEHEDSDEMCLDCKSFEWETNKKDEVENGANKLPARI